MYFYARADLQHSYDGYGYNKFTSSLRTFAKWRLKFPGRKNILMVCIINWIYVILQFFS